MSSYEDWADSKDEGQLRVALVAAREAAWRDNDPIAHLMVIALVDSAARRGIDLRPTREVNRGTR